MKLRISMTRTVSVLAVLASCAIAGPAAAADAAPVGNAQNARDKGVDVHRLPRHPGLQGLVPELYHVPMIAGQNAKYIEAALNEYRKGARSHPTMDAVAGSLSDQDIADLAAYYSSLK